jgi:acyl transferase domain-containing protein
MMQPVTEPLRELLTSIPLGPPRIPFLSNTTGTWIRDDEAVSPGYWADHLAQPVRFADGLAEVWRLTQPVLIELGPGKALSTLAARHPAAVSPVLALPALPGLFESRGDLAVLLETTGRLWAVGTDIVWSELLPT